MAAENRGRRQQVSDKTIKQLFRESEMPVRTSKDIAEQLPVTRQAINPRLKRLVEEGELERKKVGGAAVVYWLSD